MADVTHHIEHRLLGPDLRSVTQERSIPDNCLCNLNFVLTLFTNQTCRSYDIVW